jgi:hypothetical protein
MERQVAWAAGKPEEEGEFLFIESATEAYYGHTRRARDFSRRALDPTLRTNSKEAAASMQVSAALQEAELGNVASTRQGVESALALFRGRDVKMAAALALARIGDTPRAKLLAEELEKDFPLDSRLEHFQRRCIVDCGETLRQTGDGEMVWRRSAAQAAAGL